MMSIAVIQGFGKVTFALTHGRIARTSLLKDSFHSLPDWGADSLTATGSAAACQPKVGKSRVLTPMA